MIMGNQKLPAWLEALYTETFFVGCSEHENAKKNEKNICCLDCCTSICPHCLPSHRFHRLLQVRRYVYHDVVRLEDLHKLIDCSNVQVVFIKKRPQNRQFKGSASYCTSCDRTLQQPFIHCSLGCKVDFVVKHDKDLSPYLRKCNSLQLSPDFLFPQEMEDDEEVMSGSSNNVKCGDEELMSSSSSENMSLAFTENKIVRKKRSGWKNACARLMTNKVSEEEDMDTSCMSRRKGIPQRSPLS
ncbi:protein RGF1 INDUCIBLE TRANSCRIPTION FACTOR 1-like isoform X2 [Lotus japonicus]|uniref:protein RGF1 INDUCIBLE TRANSCRIPTION FACTOR 1-like isoform X2 n=1 Tax=Lotus japonicus TaxID=34305 RepID=UPI00258FBF00|nr:protein RGF1 INDUCIBLE TRANSCRIPTION FACTOR 1-like isoform X2 [Lotus japonicus]